MQELTTLRLKKVVKDGCEIYVPANQLTSLICELRDIKAPSPQEITSMKEMGYTVIITQS